MGFTFRNLTASAVILGTGFVLLAAQKPAQAQFDVQLIDVTDAGGGLFDFNYNFSVQSGRDIVAGDFVTLYDFNGFTGFVTDSSPTITSSSQNVGLTPAFQAPPDNAAVANITFTTTAPSGPTASLFTASIRTTIGQSAGQFTAYSSQGRDTTTQSGTPVFASNTAFTQGPNLAITTAPEPGTVALVAMGLMGTAGMVIRRRK